MPETEENESPAFSSVSQIIELLEPLTQSGREHVLRTVAMWFNASIASSSAGPDVPRSNSQPPQAPHQAFIFDDDKFSDRPVLSAKDFILEKDPHTEVERLACLAYYLTHYLGTPHFKNNDLAKLNTEAAQRRLSNPAVAANNAMRDGFFVQAPKAGYKQLSAMGERFVLALPNREAAQQVKQKMATRRGRRNSSSSADRRDADSAP